MPSDTPYTAETVTRAQVDALAGLTVIEFGTNWCGYCRAAQPAIDAGVAAAEGLRYLKVEDGPGRPLGRSYRIKLWPTLVFLRDGQEVARLVRPNDALLVREALDRLNPA